MKISVALCTHNGEAFVGQQVKSILDQAYPPNELVLSDDASTDGTVEIVESVVRQWKAAHPVANLDFRILRNTAALGVTANFEQALAACSGDLIALSDQDDVWNRERLTIMVAELGNRPALLLLASDALLVDDQGVSIGRTLLDTLRVSSAERQAVHAGNGLAVLLRRNVVTGATTLIRRDLVKMAQPFPLAWVHDEWLAMIAALAGDFDLLEQALVDYRQHGGNQIGATRLGLGGRISRLCASRTARNERLLARAIALHDRAAAFQPPLPKGAMAQIDAKLSHERMRSSLPAARLRRIKSIVRGWRAGGYTNYGLGMQDALRDLVQPV
jgi:glycosyltransferase involved in cell wall biosynthesis